MPYAPLCLTLALLIAVTTCDRRADAAPPATADLTVARGLALPSTAATDVPDVTLGVIPTRPISGKTWLNPFTNAVEQRIVPAILHPIPVLRAPHVILFRDRPDPAAVGLDQLLAAPAEVQLSADARYALVVTRANQPFLLTLTDTSLPQDREADWRVRVSAQPVTLPEHVADPVADRGRAVPAREPLPLTGRLVFGRQNDDRQTFTLVRRDASPKADGKATVVGKGRDLRLAANGAYADRTDENTIEVTDPAGRRAGTIKLDTSIEDFNLSHDGKRVVLATERRPLDKDGNLDVWGKNRPVSAVYNVADAKLLGEVENCDDAAFLPDGRLVVTGRYFSAGLFIADLKTAKKTPITFDGGKEDGEPPVTATSPRTPVVSPDGKRLAYCDGRDVHLVDLDGRNWTPLWKNPEREPQHRPAFSPDGRFLAVINNPLTVMDGPGQILVFDLDRQLRQPVGGPADADSYAPLGWLP